MKNALIFFFLLFNLLNIQAQTTFGEQQLVSTVPQGVRAIHYADLDGDNDMDVLSASYSDNKIAWYENDGLGGFGDQQVISIEAEGARDVYATDLDGDGDIDVLSASQTDDKIAWYENDGNGNFGAQQIISTEADFPYSIHAEDLDGDGDMDVLSASYSDDKIAWYENDGSGGFGAQQIITTNAKRGRDVYAADIDGDGDMDVLSASSYYDGSATFPFSNFPNKIAWYENDGSGNFGFQQIISDDADGANTVYAEDLDGDGDMDVLSASTASYPGGGPVDYKIAWYENDGSGNFGSQQIISTDVEGANSVYAIDLDGDGDVDVLSTDTWDDKVAWYENDGSANFSDQIVIYEEGDNPQSVFALDIDNDGDLDVLSTFSNGIIWHENDASTNFINQHIISPSTLIPEAVFSIDLDEDGDMDVLSASSGDDKIAWYENDGAGNLGAQQVISIEADGATDVYAVDLDSDGDIDVLSASQLDDKIAWYENDGNLNFGAQQIISTEADEAQSVYAADLDGDGDIDVLSASQLDDKIAWYENDGNGNFGAQNIIIDIADGATDVYTVDLDGDGDMDVISASQNDDKVVWYENDGNGGFGAQQIITELADHLESIYAADLDADGDIDVLSASGADNKIAWYANDGNGVFGTQQIISTQANGAKSVYAADLDSDGDMDVLSAFSLFSTNKIAWYENDGAGGFGSQQIISTEVDGANSIYAADLDGDNYIDVLSASADDAKVAWYKNLLSFNGTISVNNLPCFGFDNGSLQFTVNSLPNSFLTYEWSSDTSSGMGESDTDIFTIDGLSVGTYNITITNVYEETVIFEDFILGEIAGNIFEVFGVNTINSTNELSNGAIALAVNGGVPDYTYSWDGPETGTFTTNSATDTIQYLFAGNYSITITDGEDNSIVQEVSLLDEDVPGEICNGALDILILNDVSGSVDATEYEQSKVFYVDFINSLNIGIEEEDSRVGIIEWSDTDDQLLVTPITGDISLLQNYMNETRLYFGGTNPNSALTYAYDYLEEEAREEATKILVLSTDGSGGQVSESLVALADQYKAEGYVIVTIAFDNAYTSSYTQGILQQVANINLLAPGAATYAELDLELANYIVNIYICTSDPGTSNTYYFSRDGAIEINGYSPNEFCTNFSSVDIELTVTAQQQLALPAGTPITFYYNNPETFAATPIITAYVPCAIAAGESEVLTYTLPISGPTNVWAVLNDNGAESPPIDFPITDIEELVFINNVDQIEVCTDPFPTVSALKYTTTPQPICDTIVMYTVDVCNISSLDAVGVEVEDIFPAGFELLNISINDNGCAIGEGPFDLAVGCCVSLTYEYDASNAAEGVYDNQSVALSGPPEQVYINFDGSSTSVEDVTVGEILCDSDVVLFSKEVNTTNICEESFVTYTFTIDNQTNVALQGLSFTDVLADPVIWAAEPYFVENMSIGATNITNSNEAIFTIAEIPAETIGTFQMDAYLGAWEESGDLSNTATIGNLSGFVNGSGADISTNSANVFVNALPIISTENELISCIDETNVNLSSVIFNGDDIQWLSGGDGEFSDANSETTIYTFGEQDLAQGIVNLTISASTEDCGENNEGVIIELEECELDCDSLDPIVFEYNEDCDPITEIYTLTMQVSGGLPSYDNNETYSVNGYYNDDDLSPSESFQIIIDDVTDGTVIEFWATDALGCQGYEAIDLECIKLPIELFLFSGYTNGKDNVLEWQTASEIEVPFYEIERSYDGQNFERIGEVAAQGNEWMNTAYTYIDENVEWNSCYYRLSWIDGISNVIQIKRSKPTVEVLQLPNQIIIDDNVQSIALVNMMGQIVASNKSNRLYTEDLPKGIYWVKVLIEGEYLVKKIIL